MMSTEADPLDVSIVNVALPSIGARLPATGSTLVLVAAGTR